MERDHASVESQIEGAPAGPPLMRLAGAALIAALPLQVVGFLLHPAAEELEHVRSAAYGPAHTVLFVSWVLAMLALPAMYTRQAGRAGGLGLAGFVVSMVAVAYHLYLTLYEAFAVTAMADEPAAGALIGPDGSLGHGAGALGPLAGMLLLGFPLLGVATLRARVLPRAAGWLQVAALPVFVAAAVVAGLATGGEAGPEADTWLAGMLPISLQYWCLFTGWALAGWVMWGGERPEGWTSRGDGGPFHGRVDPAPSAVAQPAQ